MKLLVIKPSSLGDIVHGLQVVASAKHQRPELEVSWVVRDWFAPIVRACPAVAKVIEFDRKGGGWHFLKVIREIRQERYDLVWDMQGLLRSGIMTFAARAEKKWGRCDGREGATLFYESIEPPLGGFPNHAVQILSTFQRTLGLADPLVGRVPLSFPGAYAWVRFFQEARSEQTFILFLDSRGPKKEWKGFEALTGLLFDRIPEARVCWCGGAAVAPKIEVPAERFLNLTACPFIEMLALCNQPAIYVTNDSGPMHIAAAVGRKVMGIFGPTPPARFGPYPLEDPTHHWVEGPDGDLARLDPETVYAALMELVALP